MFETLQAIAEGINEQKFVQKILHDQGDFLQKECWHFDKALNHILKCVAEDLGLYMTETNAKTTGKLFLDDVNQAKLCGLSVTAIAHVFGEIRNAAGINNTIEITSMNEFDIGRLLQV